MIKVTYCGDKEIQDWYTAQITELIMKKQKKAKSKLSSCSPVFKGLAGNLKAMDKKVIHDILLLGRSPLVKKYSWIDDYVKLCDFASYYNELVEEAKETKDPKLYPSMRKRYLNEFRGRYLDQIIADLGIDEKKLVKSWGCFDTLKRKAAAYAQEANRLISSIFDYEMLPAQVRQELYMKMDVDVCPYCNRQYIHTVSITDTGLYLGDLDHFYPQSRYQLFSLSLWNLVPICKPCNQLLKRFFNRHILSPLEEGFDDDCIFKAVPEDTAAYLGLNDHLTLKWEIQSSALPGKKKKMQKNIDMFHLNDVYQFQKENVKSILFSRYLQSKLYLGKIDAFLAKIYLSEQEINRLRYRTSLDKDQFHKDLLGKMTYDIIKH